MAGAPLNSLYPDALDANRMGELSDAQRRNLGALSRYRRRNAFTIAVYLVAGAVLIGFFASPSAPAAARVLIPLACLAIAAVLVVRSVAGSDALTSDLRDVRVESVEGAIGKRRTSTGPTSTVHFLDVGDACFKVASATYAAAPDAGLVRVYFLPLSRQVVNFERLPNPTQSDEITLPSVAQSMKSAFSWDEPRQRRNEARADLAAMVDAFKASANESPNVPPRDARDPRPLADAIVGTWTNGWMKVTFSSDGHVTTKLLIGERSGRWSIDGSGRLRAEITGREAVVDAWVAGDQLTIALDGKGLTFTRA